jgi:hypothetical protein
LHVTSKGPRPRPPAEGSKESKRLRTLKRRKVRHTTKLDVQAKAAQARWIATLRPTVNVDDGGGEAWGPVNETDEDYFGAFARNPAPLGPNVPAERRAENRTADIFTGRTRLEEGGKARRDWKGDAERLARELAECRRAPSAAAAPSKPKPAPKPEGYGTTDEKGQSRMFKGNPAPEAMPLGKLTTLGRLTVLVPKSGPAFRWSLRQAPLLGYDGAGRLFIVYAGRIVRRSTPAELREYGRTHWGASGEGNTRGGLIAVGPFVVFAPAKSITYTTKKGGDGELVDYVHPFGEGASAKGFVAPKIVEHECTGGCAARCAARGSIALSGGSYRVTSRGIVG